MSASVAAAGPAPIGRPSCWHPRAGRRPGQEREERRRLVRLARMSTVSDETTAGCSVNSASPGSGRVGRAWWTAAGRRDHRPGDVTAGRLGAVEASAETSRAAGRILRPGAPAYETAELLIACRSRPVRVSGGAARAVRGRQLRADPWKLLQIPQSGGPGRLVRPPAADGQASPADRARPGPGGAPAGQGRARGHTAVPAERC